MEKRKNKLLKKTLIITVAVILAIIALFLGLLTYYYIKIDYEKNKDIIIDEGIGSDDDIDTSRPDSPMDDIKALEEMLRKNIENSPKGNLSNKNIMNILVIGLDTRNHDSNGRSDVNIIVSINKKTKKIILTSILRDTYVYIPGVGNNRINAAYAYGSAPLLIETIKQNFNIAIDSYVVFNFYDFIDLIDLIGGVEINVTSEEAKFINNNILPEINRLLGEPSKSDMLPVEDATLLLNGKQALSYARIRRVGNGDFQRTERQRTIITQVINKVKKLDLIKINKFMETLLPNIKTDLTWSDCLMLTLNSAKYMSYDIKNLQVPGNGTYSGFTINGMSVLGIDFEANKKAIFDTINN